MIFLRRWQGSTETPWRWIGGRSKLSEETLVIPQTTACAVAEPELPTVGVTIMGGKVKPPSWREIAKCLQKCKDKTGHEFWWCLGDCLGRKVVAQYCRDIVCMVRPDLCQPWYYPDNPCKHKDERVDACQSCCEIDYYCCLLMGNHPRRCVDNATCCHAKCDLRWPY